MVLRCSQIRLLGWWSSDAVRLDRWSSEALKTYIKCSQKLSAVWEKVISILLRTGGIEPGVLLASGSGLRGIAEMNVNGSFGVYNYIAGDVFSCFCLICCRSQGFSGLIYICVWSKLTWSDWTRAVHLKQPRARAVSGGPTGFCRQ